MEYNDFTQKLELALAHLGDNIKKIRTGRAHPDMLSGLKAEAYGQQTPLNQMANITAPEAQLLQITPFDPQNLDAIVDAIRKDESLGFNPIDDGRVVRINIPALNEERRMQIAKQLGTHAEDARIVSRNLRQDLLTNLKKQKTSGEITEDELKTFEKQVQDELDKFNSKVEEIVKAKESEIMAI